MIYTLVSTEKDIEERNSQILQRYLHQSQTIQNLIGEKIGALHIVVGSEKEKEERCTEQEGGHKMRAMASHPYTPGRSGYPFHGLPPLCLAPPLLLGSPQELSRPPSSKKARVMTDHGPSLFGFIAYVFTDTTLRKQTK